MKRWMYSIMVLSIVLSTLGCGTETKSKDSSSKPSVVENKAPVKSEDTKAKLEIQMSWFDNPPHIFLDKETGKISGGVYRLIEEKIAPKMDVTFVWDKEASAIPRQVANFEANNAKPFASALLSKNPDREKFSTCSNKTYFQSQSAIVVKKDNPLNEVKKVEDIINLKVGFAEKATMTPFMKDERIKFENTTLSNYHETNMKKLTSGRLDAVYAPDKAALLSVIKQLKLENEVKVLDLPEPKMPFYVVFSKSASEILKKYNDTTESMDLEKEYRDMLSQFVDSSKF